MSVRFHFFTALLVVGCGVVAWLLPMAGPSAVVVGYAALFLPYLALVRSTHRGEFSLPLILLGAVAARIVLVGADPLLSDDIYRYVWEGRVTLAGANPFVLSPDAGDIAHLRDESIWPLINHAEVPTIYPPASQGFFALNAAIGGGIVSLKLLFLAFEAAMLAIVWRVTRNVERSKIALAFAIYALNPLVIVEVAWSGHLDVVAWGALVAGLVVWEARPLDLKTVAATGLLLGLSISAKLLGVLALPFLLTSLKERDPGRRFLGPIVPPRLTHRVATIVLALAVVVVSYAPFAGAGSKLFSGFGTYAAAWRSNEGAYRAISTLTQEGLEAFATPAHRTEPDDPDSTVVFRFEVWNAYFLERGWTKTWEGETLPNTTFTAYMVAQTTAKLLAAFVCFLALLWLVLARWRPLAATGALLLTLYFVAPTVHPWYVAWLVPFAALRPRSAPIAFSGLVLIGYVAWISMAAGGPWAIPWWLVTLEYGVVMAFALNLNKVPVIVEETDTFTP